MSSIRLSQDKEEKKTFSFSNNVNGVNKTVRGEEVENGWIVTIDKDWRTAPTEGYPNGEYQSEVKKYISKDNPLENIKKKKDNPGGSSSILDAFKDAMSLDGKLLVD